MKNIFLVLFLFSGILFAQAGEFKTHKGTQETLWQDPTNDLVVLNFLELETTPPTSLASNVSVFDSVLTLNSATGFTSGDLLGIFSEDGRFTFGGITNIAGTVCTLDVELDYAYQAGDVVLDLNKEMNVDGSTTRRIFNVKGGGAGALVSLDITRIIITMTTTNAPDLTMFGDIVGGLTRGLFFRVVRASGEVRNLFNWKTNKDITNTAYDLTIYDAPKFGVNGISSRLTFSDPSKMGAVIRLEPGDELQAIVSDDLTSILSMLIIAEGHIKEE